MTETAASFAPVIWGNPGGPSTAITLVQGTTWEIFLLPKDAYGAIIPTSGATAALQISSGGVSVAELTGSAATNPAGQSGFLFSFTEAQQIAAGTIAGTPYLYEIQVTITALTLASTQASGPFYVQPSLFT